jgi:hypothetical protein
MKFIITVLVSVIIFSGCKKIDPSEIHEYEEIRTQYTERLTMTFPSIAGINIPWLDIGTFPVGAEFNERYKSNNPYLHLVEDVKPTRIKVTLIAPSNKEFDFIKHKKVYISTPTQPEILLGRIDNLSDNVGKVMYMVPQDVRLDKYMTEEMSMRVEVTADRSLLQQVDVAVELTVDARVKN